jgi:Lipocalin-like domain
MLMRALVAAATAAWLACGMAFAGQDEVAKRFVGTWRLVSITLNGTINPMRGAKPTGVIIYDGNGNMAVQIMPDRERPSYPGGRPTGEEAQAVLYGYTAYFGTYTVNAADSTVTHHRQGNLVPGAAHDVVRKFEFAPSDRVILRPVENPGSELIWERVKSP